MTVNLTNFVGAGKSRGNTTISLNRGLRAWVVGPAKIRPKVQTPGPALSDNRNYLIRSIDKISD